MFLDAYPRLFSSMTRYYLWSRAEITFSTLPLRQQHLTMALGFACGAPISTSPVAHICRKVLGPDGLPERGGRSRRVTAARVCKMLCLDRYSRKYAVRLCLSVSAKLLRIQRSRSTRCTFPGVVLLRASPLETAGHYLSVMARLMPQVLRTEPVLAAPSASSMERRRSH